jgi:hypothetical protein
MGCIRWLDEITAALHTSPFQHVARQSQDRNVRPKVKLVKRNSLDLIIDWVTCEAGPNVHRLLQHTHCTQTPYNNGLCTEKQMPPKSIAKQEIHTSWGCSISSIAYKQ